MRIVCCVCGQIEDADFFFEEGWASAKCVQKASEIRQVYEIEGRTYTKLLKSEREDGARAIVRRLSVARK